MAAGATETGIFARIVCGVDGTTESLYAVRQANRLREPEGTLLLVVAVSLAKTAQAGMAATPPSSCSTRPSKLWRRRKTLSPRRARS